MSKHPEDWYRERAAWHGEGVEVDADAAVSLGDGNGAYVQVWIWVADDCDEEPS